jgi:hypothetical protein
MTSFIINEHITFSETKRALNMYKCLKRHWGKLLEDLSAFCWLSQRLHPLVLCIPLVALASLSFHMKCAFGAFVFEFTILLFNCLFFFYHCCSISEQRFVFSFLFVSVFCVPSSFLSTFRTWWNVILITSYISNLVWWKMTKLIIFVPLIVCVCVYFYFFYFLLLVFMYVVGIYFYFVHGLSSQ